MKKILTGMLLSVALCVPAALQAQDHDEHQDKRYYDNSHKDYHQWNTDEDSSYHQWLKDNHRKDHDWAHASKKEQQQYWNWKHEHGDSDHH